jgi:proteasome activator subunit 4
MSDALGVEYYSKLAMLWGQESNQNGGKTQLRTENIAFVKTICKYSFHAPSECD